MIQPQSEFETYLRQFHALHPGVTSRTMNRARTADGRSTYDLLADLIPLDDRPLTILDLGCGDGYLLALIQARRGQPVDRDHFIGIDFSPDELAAARERLGAAAMVDLRLERAQQLSILDSSVDVLVSHLALMLMEPLDQVAHEIRRVLKPGGIFGAILSISGTPANTALEAFGMAMGDAIAKEGAPPAISTGDPLAETADGLRTVFSAEVGFDQPISIQDVVTELDDLPETISDLLHGMYLIDRLSAEGQQRFDDALAAQLAKMARDDGKVPFVMRSRLVICKAHG